MSASEGHGGSFPRKPEEAPSLLNEIDALRASPVGVHIDASVPLPGPRLLDEQIEFMMEIAVALHAFGEPAHTLEGTMCQIAGGLGVESSFFASPTALYASFGRFGSMNTRLVRVEAQRIDLGRLRYINEVASEVASGERSVGEGVMAVREIVGRPPWRATPPWIILTPALQAAAITLMLEGSFLDLLVATVLAVGTGLLIYVFGRKPRAALLVAFISALYGSFWAFSLQSLGVPISPYTVTVCAVVALMPGLAFTTSILELSTRNLTAGTARMMGALLVLMQLGAGLAFGVLLARLTFGDDATLTTYSAPPTWLVFGGAMALSVSLFSDYRAARSDFFWIFAGGCLTFGSYLLLRGRFGIEPAIFSAALAAGVFSEYYVKQTARPLSVVLVPSITMLVPGIVGFRSISSLILDDLQSGLELGFSMGITAVALASGVLVASVVFDSTRWVFQRSEGAFTLIRRRGEAPRNGA